MRITIVIEDGNVTVTQDLDSPVTPVTPTFTCGDEVYVNGDLESGNGEVVAVQPNGGISVRFHHNDRRIKYNADEVGRKVRKN